MDEPKSDQVEGVQSGEMTNVTLIVPFPTTFTYSNATAFSLTAMDLKIGFAEAMPNRTVEARVGVTLPIDHAAHLALTLFAQLAAYERSFGPIRYPGWQELRKRYSESLERSVAEKEPPEAE